jgi:hypothetical protein
MEELMARSSPSTLANSADTTQFSGLLPANPSTDGLFRETPLPFIVRI